MKPHRCGTCGRKCHSTKTPPECQPCINRRAAGEFWSPPILRKCDGRWVIDKRRRVQVWQPYFPEQEAS